MSRKYTLKQRAIKQDETRKRILGAVVALHEEVGPAQTSISAIAERAGVQRLTVYRHFPDESEMFDACRNQWMDSHPVPDLAPLRALSDPAQRLRQALLAMYHYYEQTEAMTANVIRDAAVSETVATAMQPMLTYLGSIHRMLRDGWDEPVQQPALLDAVIAHALDFMTWQSLVRRQGLTNDQVAEIMSCLVQCVADREP